MIYTCQQCAHQSEEDAQPTRKGAIQPGVERWCVPCKTTRFHYAALTGSAGTLPASSKVAAKNAAKGGGAPIKSLF